MSLTQTCVCVCKQIRSRKILYAIYKLSPIYMKDAHWTEFLQKFIKSFFQLLELKFYRTSKSSNPINRYYSFCYDKIRPHCCSPDLGSRFDLWAVDQVVLSVSDARSCSSSPDRKSDYYPPAVDHSSRYLSSHIRMPAKRWDSN